MGPFFLLVASAAFSEPWFAFAPGAKGSPQASASRRRLTSSTYTVTFTGANTLNDAYYTSGSDMNGALSGEDPTITINVGDTIDFYNQATGHPLMLSWGDGTPLTAPSFNSGMAVTGPSGTASYTFSQAGMGTYKYYCQTHPDMHGFINVIDTSAPSSPAPSSSSCENFNPCSCHEDQVPQNWKDAGFTAMTAAQPVPQPSDETPGWTGYLPEGCYNTNATTGAPQWMASCSYPSNTCLSGYCQNAGYEYYYPAYNYTAMAEASGLLGAPGICQLWHGGTVSSLGQYPVVFAVPDCTCGGYKESFIHFGGSNEHTMHCKYDVDSNGNFNMANTGCFFTMAGQAPSSPAPSSPGPSSPGPGLGRI